MKKSRKRSSSDWSGIATRTGEGVAAKDAAHASHGIRLTRRRRGKRVVERRDGDEGMMGE